MLQIQMKATTKQSTGKISATTFEKVTRTTNSSSDLPSPRRQIQVVQPVQQQGPTYSTNGLLHQKYCLHYVFNASLQNISVASSLLPLTSAALSRLQSARPPLIPSVTLRMCLCLNICRNQLPGDDYQNSEIVNAFHCYSSFQWRHKEKKPQKRHCCCAKLYGI